MYDLIIIPMRLTGLLVLSCSVNSVGQVIFTAIRRLIFHVFVPL